METETSYWIGSIDVHKSMLAVVAADVAGQGPLQLERRKFGTTANQVRELAAWLAERNGGKRQASIDARPGADSQPGGVSAGRCADQAVRCCQRSTGGEQSPDAAGSGRWRNRCRQTGGAG